MVPILFPPLVYVTVSHEECYFWFQQVTFMVLKNWITDSSEIGREKILLTVSFFRSRWSDGSRKRLPNSLIPTGAGAIHDEFTFQQFPICHNPHFQLVHHFDGRRQGSRWKNKPNIRWTVSYQAGTGMRIRDELFRAEHLSHYTSRSRSQ